MENTYNAVQENYQATRPKVGRPMGNNRMALSQVERRKRNAYYEAERRREYSAATMELAEAVGCASTVTQKMLLKTTISFLKHKPSVEISKLKEQNYMLKREIEQLKYMLEQPK